MTRNPTTLAQLLDTRARLRTDLSALLTNAHKRFLLSLVATEPNWSLAPFPHLRDLPAVKWKLLNLEKLKRSNSARFREQAEKLKQRFG